MSNDLVEFIPAQEFLPLEESSKPLSRQAVVTHFADTFELIGGVPRMATWANEHPTDFYKLYARLLPTAAQTQLEHSGEVIIKHVLPRGPLDE